MRQLKGKETTRADETREKATTAEASRRDGCCRVSHAKTASLETNRAGRVFGAVTFQLTREMGAWWSSCISVDF